MARLARVEVPGLPHLVTQRGIQHQQVFFEAVDYRVYLDLLAEHARAAGVAVWAYCLMPNHVNLIVVPRRAGALRAALGEAHRRYARHVNGREGWLGSLWQGRFTSVPMDEAHLLPCACYVELNPVRAKLARSARAWRWSSARAHLAGQDDAAVKVKPLLERAPDWKAFLRGGIDAHDLEAIRAHERTGRPLGSARFVARLEKRLGRKLAKAKPGPKPKVENQRQRPRAP